MSKVPLNDLMVYLLSCINSVIVYPSALDLFRFYSKISSGWNGWKTIVKSVHFGSQVAGMPCQNNHSWLDFGYRDVWQPCIGEI